MTREAAPEGRPARFHSNAASNDNEVGGGDPVSGPAFGHEPKAVAHTLRRTKSANSAERVTYRASRAYRAIHEWQLPTLESAALHGLAGCWVEATELFTEACRAGVLVPTLVAFGAAVGRSPFVQVGATFHHAHEFAAMIGPTATARKGDGMNLGLRPIRLADPALRVVRGFGSGEAVVAEVADADGDEAPSPDKRLLVHEDELSSPLAVASRDGSTLSPLLRSAWDGSRLENRTRKATLVATDAHVSVLAGITPEELVRRVPATEIASGFLNRFLLVAVRRARALPNPPRLTSDVENRYIGHFREALARARQTGEMRRDREASERWETAYCEELSVERPDLAGAACSRAEAHTLRLSMLYALLDCSSVIRLAHVEAALAVWRYSEQSAYRVFGNRMGDPIADTIVQALADAGDLGLTRDDIRRLFSGHRSSAELDLALERLERAGLVVSKPEATGGRPATRYRLAQKVTP